ncbi:hypothetical protein B0H14DRAFT_3127979 [Mycena olivaceomarginata]|nr:hypothetical protein B0H14DRAFT_3127979 [Mycena olivaceomarginata]
MPLFHVGGIVRNLLAPIFPGAAPSCVRASIAMAFWTLARDLQASWYYAAPTIHHAILTSQPAHDLRMRMITNAAGGFLPSLAVSLKSTFGGHPPLVRHDRVSLPVLLLRRSALYYATYTPIPTHAWTGHWDSSAVAENNRRSNLTRPSGSNRRARRAIATSPTTRRGTPARDEKWWTVEFTTKASRSRSRRPCIPATQMAFMACHKNSGYASLIDTLYAWVSCILLLARSPFLPSALLILWLCVRHILPTAGRAFTTRIPSRSVPLCNRTAVGVYNSTP